MPWKKDLAKLKQDLGKEEGLPAKSSPPPKAKPAHPVSQSIEEEDNIFLNAMGLRAKPAERQPSAAAAPPSPAPLKPAPAPAAGKVEFSAAMGDLKGMKPLKPAPVQEKAAPKVPPASPEPPPPAVPDPAPAPVPEDVQPVPEPAPQAGALAPTQAEIHLAAGMAIVVDGSLDLKGHARLKERLLDGYALGWRTLHVVVGPSEELRAMVLDLLKSPAGRCIARYAQAPVPMGGAQAWILYFHGPGVLEN